MKKQEENLIGKKYGNLTVIKKIPYLHGYASANAETK